MKLAMTSGEQTLLEGFLRLAHRYVEFGSGGSTVLAAGFCDQVTTVDSSLDWLDKVAAATADKRAQVNRRFVDIGPTRDWGFPNIEDPVKFESYSRAADLALLHADFVLVDGRFRVACFARVCELGFSGPIAFHDYPQRPWYFAVETIADPIAKCDSLYIFKPRHRRHAAKLWSYYRHDPR